MTSKEIKERKEKAKEKGDTPSDPRPLSSSFKEEQRDNTPNWPLFYQDQIEQRKKGKYKLPYGHSHKKSAVEQKKELEQYCLKEGIPLKE
jgi:hypothetical protein